VRRPLPVNNDIVVVVVLYAQDAQKDEEIDETERAKKLLQNNRRIDLKTRL
jgi:hypothetical protein